MQHLNRMRTLYGIPKRKAPHTGEVVCGAKKRTPGKSCSRTFMRCDLPRQLPRNLDGVDRGELGPSESRIDGREHHAATAATLDHHSRQRGPHAGDALRLGKNQRYCGSRHHGVGQSNGRASATSAFKSTTCPSTRKGASGESDATRHLVTRPKHPALEGAGLLLRPRVRDHGHTGLLRHREPAADGARLYFIAYFGLQAVQSFSL